EEERVIIINSGGNDCEISDAERALLQIASLVLKILGGIPQILKALEIISSQIRYGAGKTHPAKDKLERHLADAQMFDMAWMVTHKGGAAIKYDTKFVCKG
ncbi:hypothetical protein IFM89_008483, partial [Coptis chinensis]